MLVDPNTGLPIEQEGRRSAGQKIIGSENKTVGAATAFGEELGVVPDNKITDQFLNTVPGGFKTTAWNAYRGSRTIAYGGAGVNQVSGFRATFSPEFLRRMPSYSALGGRDPITANYGIFKRKYKPRPPGPLNTGLPGESYTPFNILYKAGNYGMKKASNLVERGINFTAKARVNSGAAATMQEAVTSTLDDVGKTKPGRAALRVRSLTAEGDAFSGGTVSRIVTGDKMARGKLPGGNILNFLQETDKSLANAFRAGKSAEYSAAQMMPKGASPFGAQARMPMSIPLSVTQPTAQEAAWLSYGSTQGSLSGRLSGFMGQMRLGDQGGIARTAVMGENQAAAKGIQAAERFMAKGGFERVGGKFTIKAGTAAGDALASKAGLRAGEKVTMKAAAKVGGKMGLKIGARLGAAAAVNAVPVLGQVVSAVMLADLAMDVGKLGVEVFKSGVDFAKEAAVSYKGSINKGVMGMGYRDNTVAATSRARGVQAIQNSRLNARSVLGSEAGAMAAHFG